MTRGPTSSVTINSTVPLPILRLFFHPPYSTSSTRTGPPPAAAAAPAAANMANSPTQRVMARAPGGRLRDGGDRVARRVRLILRQFLRADDGQVQADLDRHRLAVNLDRRLAVQVPAERAGRELLDLGHQR